MTAPPVAPLGPLVVVAIERRLVDRLRAEHATVPERAVRLDDLKWMQSRRLAQLARVGAVHEASAGRWYLDEPVYAEYIAHRRRMIVIAVAAALLAAVAVSLLFRS
jgi:hypothetical protein